MEVTDLGRMPYARALAVQRALNERVAAGTAPPTLLLVEHDPVITIGRRAALREELTRNLRVDPQRLAQLGIDLQKTDRGGDVTYHGPGQIVAYPIVRLGPLQLAAASYVHLLEQIVIDTLARFDVRGVREEGVIGVWVARKDQPSAAPPAKVCAIGVRIRRDTTMHGLALNVSTDLDHFQTIVPCGLTGREVTSLQALLGAAAPALDQVKAVLVESLCDGLEGAEGGKSGVPGPESIAGVHHQSAGSSRFATPDSGLVFKIIT